MKLNTLEHLFHVQYDVRVTCDIFGATAQFIEELGQRSDQIAESLIKELNVAPEQINGLPLDTPLPPVAEEKFIALREWLCLNDSMFGPIQTEALEMERLEKPSDVEPPFSSL